MAIVRPLRSPNELPQLPEYRGYIRQSRSWILPGPGGMSVGLYGRVNKVRCVVVPIAVDLARFNTTDESAESIHDEPGWDNSDRFFSLIGRVASWKGQDYFKGMAAGSAVIATDAGGAPDIIENDVNGLLVPMKDSRALARAMLRLSKKDQLSDRLCSAATKVVHYR